MTEQSLAETLKPCPFCGGEADPEGWSGSDVDGGNLRHGPACDDCGASAESAAAWNRRSLPPPPAEGVRERLRALAERLMGPHEWGYRCITEGTFIEDNTPFEIAAVIALSPPLAGDKAQLEGDLRLMTDHANKLSAHYRERVARLEAALAAVDRLATEFILAAADADDVDRLLGDICEAARAALSPPLAGGGGD